MLHISSLIGMSEVVDDGHKADVGTNDACKEADGEENYIFDASVEEPPLSVDVPVRGRVDEGGRHEGERGHLDRSEQGD